MLCAFLLLAICQTTVEAREGHFESGRVRIRYVERGEGRPVVLIHGFSRSIETNWAAPGILEALAKAHRVIALDCRGHGRSDKPEGDDAYGRKMVEDVLRLLDHLKIERATLIGYSMGGRIALKFATVHPDRVRSAILIGAGAARPEDDHSLWDGLAQSLQEGDGIRPLILKIWPTNQPGPSEEQIRAINEQVLAANDATALASVARGYREFAVTEEQIREMRVPLLATVGSLDSFRPLVDALSEWMPDARVIVVDGVGHLGILQRLEVGEAIERFLNADR